jgi:hypothetical protein
MAELLCEYEPITLQILEDDSAKGRLVIGGRFGLAGEPNANGRIYPLPLWKKILESERVLSTLNSRRMLGLIEHPADGKTDPTKASHIVTNLSINENNEIIGRAEILNTPNGLILQELFRAGCQMGISSRGTGTLSKGPKGDIVNEDYMLHTFDLVLTPSTALAYPKPLSESSENIKELAEMTAHEKYLDFEQRAQTVLEADVSNNAGRKLVENAATKLLIELSEASVSEPSLKELFTPLIEELNAKRKLLRKPISEETFGDADHGITRVVPQEPPPPPGEGWPLDPNDAGPATGLGDHVNPWMQATQEESVNEEEEEKKGKKCKTCGNSPCTCEENQEEESVEESILTEEQSDFMATFANKVVELPESEENSPFRALAAAYLLEKDSRLNEAEGYERVIEKIQEKISEASTEGKIVLESADELLQQKYNVSLHIIEELKNRLTLLSAKVYAENKLETIGRKNDKEARKAIFEAIQKDPSRKSIDEAIAFLVPIKGMKAGNKQTPVSSSTAITESTKTVEGAVNSLTESVQGSRAMGVEAMVSRLSRNMTSSRPAA